MVKAWVAALAVVSALALGAACEQKGGSTSERGSTTSTPVSRGPAGESDRASARSMGTAPTAAGSSSDLSGTGGAGDAGLSHADGGTRMR